MLQIAPVLAILIALLNPSTTRAQVSVSDWLEDGAPIVVAPNRSVRLGGYPENSIAGILYAIDRGFGMVHVNPQLTRDDGYVLMHDSTLNRTTDVEAVFPVGPPSGPSRTQRGGRDYVRDYTLEEIRRLRLTDGSDGGEHPVPTLDEALDAAGEKIIVRLGLKIHEIDSLAGLLEARPATGNVLLFDAFYADPTLLRDISAATGLPAAVSLSNSKNPVVDLERIAENLAGRLALVVVTSEQLDPSFAAAAERIGLRIAINGWVGGEDSSLEYKNDPGPWIAAMRSGAVAMMTIQPEKVLDLLSTLR